MSFNTQHNTNVIVLDKVYGQGSIFSPQNRSNDLLGLSILEITIIIISLLLIG